VKGKHFLLPSAVALWTLGGSGCAVEELKESNRRLKESNDRLLSENNRLEEELAALQVETAGAAPAASKGPKLWALNGRQAQMQLRNLMQLRAFGRMA